MGNKSYKYIDGFRDMAKTFEQVISETLEGVKPSKQYKIPDGSGSVKVAPSDSINFNKLAAQIGGNAGVGKGEIALYWLYGKKANHQGGGSADLILWNKQCEVKSYPNHNTMTLGKFKSSYIALELITFLFSFNNLFMKFGTSKTGSTNYKSLLTFGVVDLVKSLEYYNILKIVFSSKNVQAELSKLSKGSAEAVNAFKDISKSCNAFIKQLKKLKIFSTTKTEKDRQVCAAGIVAFLLQVKLKEKPGDKGYMVNYKKVNGVIRDNSPIDIHFHKVDVNRMMKSATYETLKDGFSVSSGEIQIKSATAIFK
jgi:hypothetical protein